jgi:hypothetical protein
MRRRRTRKSRKKDVMVEEGIKWEIFMVDTGSSA